MVKINIPSAVCTNEVFRPTGNLRTDREVVTQVEFGALKALSKAFDCLSHVLPN